MSIEAVVRVAVRLLAIWIWVSGTAGLASVAALDRSTLGYTVVAGMTTLSVAVQIVAGVVLWKYAAWVATHVAAGTPQDGGPVGQSPASMTQAAVGVLGVFMLLSAIPDSLWYSVAFVASRLAGPSPLVGQPSYAAQMGLYAVGGIANMAAVLTRLLLGLLLVFRSGSVTSAILVSGSQANERGRPTRG